MTTRTNGLKLINAAAGLLLVTLIVFILQVGRDLILPLVIALVIWYLIVQFTLGFHRIKLGSTQLPYGICLVLSIISAALVIYLFLFLLTASIGNILAEAPKYQDKLKTLLSYVSLWTGNHLDMEKLLGNVNLPSLFSTLTVVLSNLLGNFVLILIYLLFLLLEAKTFPSKLAGMCKDKNQHTRIKRLIGKIHRDINKFLQAKLIINSLAGFASYICLLFFHVDYAEFWGMLVFLLHFIPFIGPIVAVLFVMLAVSIQISSLLLFTLLAALLIIIQFVMGNVLEPKMMGARLNLSPIVILISLAFWGYLWGVVGMFLCVPMMVIINIIFAHFPKTLFISVMLSAHWDPLKGERGFRT